MKPVVLGLLFFVSISHAADFSVAGIYSATKEACLNVKVEDLHNLKADRLRAGYFPSAKFTELLNYLRRSGVRSIVFEQNFRQNHAVSFILDNSDFNRALSECYPQQPEMINFFKKAVAYSDRAGRLAGVAAVIALLRGQGALLRQIELSYNSVYLLLDRLQKVGLVVFLTSLMRSDREQSKERKSLEFVIAERNDEYKEVQDLASNSEMLQKQIADLEDKIKSCGSCGQQKEFQIEHQALVELLHSLQ